MCLIFVTLFQIASEASFDGVDQDGIWDHFCQVSVPAIKHWQATAIAPPPDICQLLVTYAKRWVDSEVPCSSYHDTPKYIIDCV